MFNSVSSCTPNSTAQSQYTATTQHELDIWANITVRRDGSVVTTRPITVGIGNVITATANTSASYLGYRFIPYSINGLTSYFALANRNLYNPTIKINETYLRWYNYPEYDITLSKYGAVQSQNFLMANNSENVDIDSLHVILNHTAKSVHFYDESGFVASANLEAGPIDFRKINYETSGTYTQDIIVLANNGKLYRIRFDRRIYPSSQFTPAVSPIFVISDLPYNELIPGRGDVTDIARANLLRALFPVVRALEVDGNSLILGGSDTIYRTNFNFTLQNTYTLSGQEIIHISAFGEGTLLITTRSHNVYTMTSGGTFTLRYSSTALGQPDRISGNRVAVPEGNQQRLLIFSANGSYVTWITQDFVPAYARTFDNQLWVTGHDTNQVLKYSSDNLYTAYSFARRVTLVSVLNNSILGIHVLQNRNTLDTTGIQKVIPFTVESRSGPINLIGTSPVRPLLLCQDPVTPVAGPGIQCWSNGILNGTVSSGDYFSVSYQAGRSGDFRSCFILGETAIDYTVNVSTSSSLYDFKTSTVALHRLTGPYGTVEEPDVGNSGASKYDQGSTIFDDLGFTINMWGQSYGNINVSTNGYLTFGNDTTRDNGILFGALSADAIYVEPADLVQKNPIDNTDPTDIKDGKLDGVEDSGIYYKFHTLGEFDALRIRWVGTHAKYHPFGNTQNTVTSITSHNEIPLYSIANVHVNDYVSGSGIITSSQVVSKYSFATSDLAYESVGSNVLVMVDNFGSIPKYSRITANNNLLGYTLSNISTVLYGNAILDTTLFGSNITVDGITPTEVDSKWKFFFTPVYAHRITANSIIRTTYNITAISNTVSSTEIQISSTDYNSIYTQQSISGPSVYTGNISLKYTVTKSWALTANATTITEGNIVRINLNSMNVPAGTIYNYDISGTVDANDFVTGTSLSGQFTVGSSNQFTLLANTDLDIESMETITVTVYDIYPGLGNLSVNIGLIDSGTENRTIQQVTNSISEYFISVIPAQTLTAGDKIDVAKTEIDFGTLYEPTSYFPDRIINYAFHQLELDRAFTPVTYLTTLDVDGNFAVVSAPHTISSNTPVLFKANVPAPTYTYEVGFYIGRNYQYIELYWDKPTHDATALVGLGARSLGFINSRISTTTAFGTSILYGSEVADGIWQPLGTGSFTYNNKGFIPRKPRLEVENVITIPNSIRYNVYIDQKFPTSANVRASLDYGYLYLNGGDYTGSQGLKTNDRLTVVVPFGSSRRPGISILGIGDYQVPLATAPYSDYLNMLESRVDVLDIANETAANTSITVSNTGTYFVPLYYKSIYNSSGNDYRFVVNYLGSDTELAVGNYYTLYAGSTLTIINQFSSARKYDVRDLVIAGSIRYIRSSLRTAGDRIFNRLDYSPLVDPYVRYYDDYEEYQYRWPIYKTSNILLTNTGTSLTGNLFVSGPGLNFVFNGNRGTENLDSVTTGANIALEWTVPTYFEGNAIIYQIYPDNIDSSNVYVEIGRWPIQNRVMVTPPTLEQTSYVLENIAVDLVQSTEILADAPDHQIESAENDFSFILSGDLIRDLGGLINYNRINSEWVSAVTFLSQRIINPEFFVPSTEFSFSTTSQVETRTTEFSGRILSESLPGQYTFILVDSITAEQYAYTDTLITSSLGFDSNRIQPTLIAVNSITYEHFTQSPYNFTSNIMNEFMILQNVQFVGVVWNYDIVLRMTEFYQQGATAYSIPVRETMFTGNINKYLEYNNIFSITAPIAANTITDTYRTEFDYRWDEFLMGSPVLLVKSLTNFSQPSTQFEAPALDIVLTQNTEFGNVNIENLDIVDTLVAGKNTLELIVSDESINYSNQEIYLSAPNIISSNQNEEIEHNQTEFGQGVYQLIDLYTIIQSSNQELLENIDSLFLPGITADELVTFGEISGRIIEEYLTESLLEQKIQPIFIEENYLNYNLHSEFEYYDLLEYRLTNDLEQYDYLALTLEPEKTDYTILDFEKLESEYVGINTLENSMGSEFEQFNEFAFNIGSDIVQENTIGSTLIPDFILETELVLGIEPLLMLEHELDFTVDVEILQLPLTSIDFDPELLQLPSTTINLDAVPQQQNELVIDIHPDLQQSRLSLINLLPDWYQPIEYLQDLAPDLFRPIEYWQDLAPELFRPIEVLPELIPIVVQQHLTIVDFQAVMLKPADTFIGMEWRLDQDYLHYTDGIYAGATFSYIGMYANDGLHGDKRAYPSDLPFVFYQRSYNYGSGGYTSQLDAATVAAKYVSAQAIQIVGTDYWNYRINFDLNHSCVPRKGMVFPYVWLIRGG